MNHTLTRYIVVVLSCFLVSAVLWKVRDSRKSQSRKRLLSLQNQVSLTPESILVTIGGHKITYRDLEWEFKIQTQTLMTDVKDDEEDVEDFFVDTETPELHTLKYKLLANMVERIILYQNATKDSEFNADDPGRFTKCLEDAKAIITGSPQLFTEEKPKEILRNRLCETSIIQQYLDERLAKKIQINAMDVEAYYAAHAGDFNYPARVVIRQIVLPDENQAKKVAAQVRRSNFAQLAAKYSIAPEAEDGGKLGPFAKGQLPGVFDVAFSMQIGQISSILKSEYGFHIILVESKLKGGTEDIVKASAKIENKLHEQKLREEYQKWLEKALASTNIKSDYQIW